ncbi:MAG: GGDEF domain-containing protein [Lachnospiraceae bacterium]|nr:GGDEF domain-containing protein [Lachnospiraceae bacterium]
MKITKFAEKALKYCTLLSGTVVCVLSLVFAFTAGKDKELEAKELSGWKVYRAGFDAKEEAFPIAFGKDRELTLSTVLPDINEGQFLWMDMKVKSMEVYIDGEEVYSILPYEFGLIKTTVGGFTTFIPLCEDYSGKEIKIHVITRTSRFSESVRDSVILYKSEYVTDLIRGGAPELVIGSAYIIIGLLLLLLSVGYIPVKVKSDKYRKDSFLYGSLFFAGLGFWTLSNLHLFGITSGNLVASGLFNHVSFLLLPMGGVAAVESVVPKDMVRLKKILRFGINTVRCYVTLVILAFILGLSDFPNMIIFTHILVVYAILMVLIGTVYIALNDNRISKRAVSVWVGVVGIFAVISAGFYAFDKPWRGFVLFTVLLIAGGIVSRMLISTYEMVTENIKYNEMRIHAYTDELTGIGNRRAYDLDSETFNSEKDSHKLTLAMFDVNALKETNDILGHEAGDEALKATAGLLSNCFSDIGKCYRMGGDEFLVKSNADMAVFKERVERFKKEVSEWSGKIVKELAVSCGYASRSETPGLSVKRLEKNADLMMYEDKNEYYKTHERRRKYKKN